MPLDLEGHCRRILKDIESTSQSIRHSALAYANSRQNFQVSERLRRELETIRISADAILEAIAKASVTDFTIDDRLIDWLFSGELRSCLSKLKEMDIMLNPVSPARPVPDPARPLRPGEDKLTAAMVFFNRHKGLFHFLITPHVWQVSQQQSGRVFDFYYPGIESDSFISHQGRKHEHLEQTLFPFQRRQRIVFKVNQVTCM